MLLLVTVGLVVAGAVLLVVGWIDSSVHLIYAAIACAVLAAGLLIAISLLSRRRASRMVVGAGLGPSPAHASSDDRENKPGRRLRRLGRKDPSGKGPSQDDPGLENEEPVHEPAVAAPTGAVAMTDDRPRQAGTNGRGTERAPAADRPEQGVPASWGSPDPEAARRDDRRVESRSGDPRSDEPAADQARAGHDDRPAEERRSEQPGRLERRRPAARAGDERRPEQPVTDPHEALVGQRPSDEGPADSSQHDSTGGWAVPTAPPPSNGQATRPPTSSGLPPRPPAIPPVPPEPPVSHGSTPAPAPSESAPSESVPAAHATAEEAAAARGAAEPDSNWDDEWEGSAEWEDDLDVEEPSSTAGNGARPVADSKAPQRSGEDGRVTEARRADRVPPVPAPSAPVVAESAEEEWNEEWEDSDSIFPIEDFDDLRVSEIVPLLSELEPDELLEVRQHEASAKARGTILRRIDSLLGETGAGPVAPPRPPPPSGPPPPRRSSPAAPVAAATGAPAAPAEVGGLIGGYATLRVSDIVPLLAGLTPSQLDAVEAAERSGSSRGAILTRIARLRQEAGGDGDPLPADRDPGADRSDRSGPPRPGSPPPRRTGPPLARTRMARPGVGSESGDTDEEDRQRR